jgi:hypothetical protein
MTNLSNYERETIINFNEAEQTAIVYTCNRKLQNKLNKLIAENNQDISVRRKDDESVTYIVPKKWIKVSPPRQVNYTDEQKAAMAERLAAARNKKGE